MFFTRATVHRVPSPLSWFSNHQICGRYRPDCQCFGVIWNNITFRNFPKAFETSQKHYLISCYIPVLQRRDEHLTADGPWTREKKEHAPIYGSRSMPLKMWHSLIFNESNTYPKNRLPFGSKSCWVASSWLKHSFSRSIAPPTPGTGSSSRSHPYASGSMAGVDSSHITWRYI